MLSYAFQVLNEQGYRNLATEKFENTAELCAAILAKGISKQLKRGLGKEYVEETEALSSLRGKIGISESVKQYTILKKQLVCTYDEFLVNSYMNRIIKTTAEMLLRADISKSRKRELKKLMVFFGEVDTLNPHTINWKMQYNRNNQTYRMLMVICNLVIKGLLQTTAKGSVKMMGFLDEQRMSRLYEKFILEYYRKEYQGIIQVSSAQVKWALDDEMDAMLPTMQSDIMLKYENKTLIVDAKYYSHTMQYQERYNSYSIHSNNLYQIFTYVKNEAVKGGEVSGLLLYTKTDEVVQPDQTFKMSGNQISVKTLDLGCEFGEIRKQLDRVVGEWMR